MAHINELVEKFDIDKIQLTCDWLIKTYPFKDNQLSLSHRPSHFHERWSDGCGSPISFDKQHLPIKNADGEIELRFKDTDLSVINPELEDTELGKIYREFGKSHTLGRFRLAGIKPKTCYGWHSDYENRIHIPVYTYPGCFIIVEGEPPAHLPADGRSYVFNATDSHTAINSDYYRIRYHLLINIW